MEESGVLGFGAIAAPVLPRGVAATASSLPFMLQNYSSMNETEGSAVKESRESRLLVGDPVRVLSSFALDGRQFGLSTRIRNYGDVSGNRLLTRAALIGAATMGAVASEYDSVSAKRCTKPVCRLLLVAEHGNRVGDHRGQTSDHNR